MTSFYTGKVVVIDYTNYRGERYQRRVVPRDFRFGSNEWHTKEQWLMLAVDLDRNLEREYALADIHSWTVAEDQTLPWR